MGARGRKWSLEIGVKHNQSIAFEEFHEKTVHKVSSLYLKQHKGAKYIC